jgi:hypothetical protein
MAAAEAHNSVGKTTVRRPALTERRRGEVSSSVCLIQRGVVRRGGGEGGNDGAWSLLTWGTSISC